MRRDRVVFPLLALVLLAAPARANSGTPLMWVGWFHFVFGNLLIGMWEARVLQKRFGLGNWPVGWMFAANYASAIAGLGLCALGDGLSRALGSYLLVVGLPLLLALLAIAFGLTIVVEWPFCWRIAAGREDRKHAAWRMSLTAQAASYALIVPLYLLVSPINMLFHVRPLARVAKPPAATVYYLGRDGDVWRVRTDGTGRERVMAVGASGEVDRLALVSRGRSGPADLVLVELKPGAPDTSQSILRPAFAPEGTFARRDREFKGEPHTWRSLSVMYFLPEKERKWKAEAGFWASGGIHVWTGEGRSVDLDGDGYGNEWQWDDSYRSYTLALETPFMMAYCRNITVLPNDQAVIQVGQTIALLDLPAKRLATLAAGRGPTVVLAEPVRRIPTHLQ